MSFSAIAVSQSQFSGCYKPCKRTGIPRRKRKALHAFGIPGLRHFPIADRSRLIRHKGVGTTHHLCIGSGLKVRDNVVGADHSTAVITSEDTSERKELPPPATAGGLDVGLASSTPVRPRR